MSHTYVIIFFIHFLILHPMKERETGRCLIAQNFFWYEQLRDLQLAFSFLSPPPTPFLFVSCSLEERVFNTRCTSTFNPVSSKPCVSLHFKLNYTRTPSPIPLAIPLLAFVPLCPSSIFPFRLRRFEKRGRGGGGGEERCDRKYHAFGIKKKKKKRIGRSASIK